MVRKILAFFLFTACVLSCTPTDGSNPAGSSSGSESNSQESVKTGDQVLEGAEGNDGNPLAGGTCTSIAAQLQCASDKFRAMGEESKADAFTAYIKTAKDVEENGPELEASRLKICQGLTQGTFEIGVTGRGWDMEEFNSFLRECK